MRCMADPPRLLCLHLCGPEPCWHATASQLCPEPASELRLPPSASQAAESNAAETEAGRGAGQAGQDLTAVGFEEAGLQCAVGTSGGLVAIFDLRAPKPVAVKDHMYGEAIRSVQFHQLPGESGLPRTQVEWWHRLVQSTAPVTCNMASYLHPGKGSYRTCHFAWAASMPISPLLNPHLPCPPASSVAGGHTGSQCMHNPPQHQHHHDCQ